MPYNYFTGTPQKAATALVPTSGFIWFWCLQGRDNDGLVLVTSRATFIMKTCFSCNIYKTFLQLRRCFLCTHTYEITVLSPMTVSENNLRNRNDHNSILDGGKEERTSNLIMLKTLGSLRLLTNAGK